jgi:hypothetical protein
MCHWPVTFSSSAFSSMNFLIGVIPDTAIWRVCPITTNGRWLCSVLACIDFTNRPRKSHFMVHSIVPNAFTCG